MAALHPRDRCPGNLRGRREVLLSHSASDPDGPEHGARSLVIHGCDDGDRRCTAAYSLPYGIGPNGQSMARCPPEGRRDRSQARAAPRRPRRRAQARGGGLLASQLVASRLQDPGRASIVPVLGSQPLRDGTYRSVDVHLASHPKRTKRAVPGRRPGAIPYVRSNWYPVHEPWTTNARRLTARWITRLAMWTTRPLACTKANHA